MRQDVAHQQLTEASAAKVRQDEHIQQMCKPNVIGDHARKANLTTVGVDTETQRVFDAFFDAGTRYAWDPIRVICQKGVNHRHLEPVLISRDFD